MAAVLPSPSWVGDAIGRALAAVFATAQPEQRDYDAVMLPLPPMHADAVRRLAASIPDEDLAADGREEHPHITVRYGLRGTSAEDARVAMGTPSPVLATLGPTSVFPGDDEHDYDVVKADVESADLHRLHARLGSLPHTDTYPEYRPHVTVAYVKRGLGEKYAGNTALSGHAMTFDRAVHSAADGTSTVLPLGPVTSGGDQGSDTWSSVSWPTGGRWTGDITGSGDDDTGAVVLDRSEEPGEDTEGFAAFSVPDPIREEGGYVYRRGLLFRAGSYPDKSYEMTPEEIRDAAAAFDGPIDLDLEHAPSILDHKIGQLVSVEASDDGEQLYGTVMLPKWLDDVIGPAARKVSASWDRATKRLMGLALVVRPRVADAALMAAFAERSDMADWDTQYVDNLPDDAFLAILPGGKKDGEGKTTPRDLRKLPYKDSSGKIDLPHLRNAISRLGQPDTDVPDKDALQRKAQRLLDDATASHSGMRHSAADRADMQTIHDIATRQGAECAPEPDKGGTSDMADSIEQGIQQGMMKRFFAWFAAGAPEPGQVPAPTPQPQPATFAADPAPAPDAEKERLRAEVAKLRAQQVADRAAAFAKEQVAAGKAYPAQHDAIVAAYSAAAVDDSQHGAVNFGDHSGSRVEALTALFAAAPSHGLTTEAVRVPADQLTRLPNAGQLAGTADARFSEEKVDPKEVIRLLGTDPVGKTILRDMAQRANGVISGGK